MRQYHYSSSWPIPSPKKRTKVTSSATSKEAIRTNVWKMCSLITTKPIYRFVRPPKNAKKIFSIKEYSVGGRTQAPPASKISDSWLLLVSPIKESCLLDMYIMPNAFVLNEDNMLVKMGFVPNGTFIVEASWKRCDPLLQWNGENEINTWFEHYSNKHTPFCSSLATGLVIGAPLWSSLIYYTTASFWNMPSPISS